MTPPLGQREVALEFIRYFCAGDVDGIAGLLAERFRLRGPLYQFDSREAYLGSLRDDPPLPGECRVLGVTEGNEQVAVFYEYHKRNGVITIAQLFGFDAHKIHEVLVVFDSQGFR